MSVSKECSEGRHADCTLGGMVCDCTARGGHTTQHRYVNASVSKPEKLQPVASVGETLNLTPNDRCTCSTLSSHCVKHGTKVSFGASNYALAFEFRGTARRQRPAQRRRRVTG